MRRLIRLSIATLAVVALAGCASDDKGSDAQDVGAASGTTVKLEAVQFSFTPTELELDAGTSKLQVTNSDKVKHNITVDGLDVDRDVDGGSSIEVSVDAKAGTYPFHCEYHPDQMKGTITVS